MARQIIALSDFDNESDAETLTFSSAVSTALTNNDRFTSIGEIPALEKAVEKFKELKDTSRNGNRAIIAAKNAAKADVVDLLKTIRRKVNLLCKGNKEWLATTGFNLSGEGSPKPMTEPVASLCDGKVKNALVAKVKGAAKARSFYYELSPDSTFETGVIPEANTDKEFTFQGLLPATKYYLRVMAIGTKNQKLYSNVAGRVTQ